MFGPKGPSRTWRSQANEDERNMKILVTGGPGYIGSHTLVEAVRAGHEVLVLDNFCNSTPDNLGRVERLTRRKIPFLRIDIRYRDRALEVFQRFRPDVVIHFAGLKSVAEAARAPASYYGANVTGSLNVIEAMEASGCEWLIFSSSATVYGDPEYLPIDENHPLRTMNPYGRSKLHVEEILLDQARARPDWSIAILRYFNPVGAHESGLIGESPSGIPDNLMPYLARVASGDLEELAIFGADYDTRDGTSVRDYIHVVDLARAHVAALSWASEAARGARAFNLGLGNGISVLQMISAFEAASGRPIRRRVAPRRAAPAMWQHASPILHGPDENLDGARLSGSETCARVDGAGSRPA